MRRVARRDEVLVDTRDRAVLGDVERARSGRATASTPDGVLGQPGVGEQALLDDDRATIAARSQASRPGRTWRWKSASSAVSVTPRVDHDHRAVGVVGDRLQRRAGAGDAVAHPRVLADEERDLAVLELAPHERRRTSCPLTKISPVFSWASALERNLRAERVQRGARVGAAEMVALAAAAVVDDRLAAVGVAYRAEPRRRPREIAVSQSTSSNVPSSRRRSGCRTRSPRPFW